MSDTNNNITKRKGSPEAIESVSSHKKLKPDASEPREGHAEDCTDLDCEGCADGEIEIKFDHEPTAFELFQMARDEAAKEGSKSLSGAKDGDEGTVISTTPRMAKKLFDLAIEAFEKLEQVRNTLPKDQQVSPEMIEERMKHAACEVAIGVYMPAIAMVEEGLAKYEQLIKTEVGSASGSAWVGLAIARISAARLQRKAILDTLEQDLEDLDEGSDEYDEAQQKAAIISKKEHDLVEKSLEAFDKGLSVLKEQDQILFAKESIRASQELEEYGTSIDMGFNTEFARTVFKAALNHLNQAKKVDASLVDENADVMTLHGSCLFHLARIANQEGDETGASTLFEQAEQLLSTAEELLGDKEDAKTLELLAQVYLNSAMSTEDEDKVVEVYDKAIAKLNRALELNPDNTSLQRQLEAIQGGEDEGEDFEYEDMGEDDERGDDEESEDDDEE